MAVPVGAAHLSGGPGPQGSRESSASNGCGVELGEGGACLHPRGGVGVAEKRGGGVVCWTAWAKNRLSGARTRLFLSLCLSLSCRVSADVVTRVPHALGRYYFCSTTISTVLHRIRLEASGDYPPNLSISLSGGKEINRDLPSSGERTGASPALNRGPAHAGREMWGEGLPAYPRGGGRAPHVLRQVQDGPERRTREGDSPVVLAGAKGGAAEQGYTQSESSVAWECSVKLGGGFLPRLNICLRPISHKYREGKVKRTLKRESNRARNYDDGNLCSLHKRKARGQTCAARLGHSYALG